MGKDQCIFLYICFKEQDGWGDYGSVDLTMEIKIMSDTRLYNSLAVQEK